jgi:hypothetical protein
MLMDGAPRHPVRKSSATKASIIETCLDSGQEVDAGRFSS